jgi:hypothetical protein
MKEDEEKNKAIEHGQLPFVHKGNQDTALRVKHEKGDRHFTTGEQRRDPGQETQRNHEAEDDLNPSTHCHYRDGNGFAAEHAKNFVQAVTGEEQANHEAHDAINRIREAIQRVHERRLLGGGDDVKILTRSGGLKGPLLVGGSEARDVLFFDFSICHPERSAAESKDL